MFVNLQILLSMARTASDCLINFQLKFFLAVLPKTILSIHWFQLMLPCCQGSHSEYQPCQNSIFRRLKNYSEDRQNSLFQTMTEIHRIHLLKLIRSKIDRIQGSEFIIVLPEELFSILNETRIQLQLSRIHIWWDFLHWSSGDRATLRNQFRIDLISKVHHTIIDSTHWYELSCPLYMGWCPVCPGLGMHVSMATWECRSKIQAIQNSVLITKETSRRWPRLEFGPARETQVELNLKMWADNNFHEEPG